MKEPKKERVTDKEKDGAEDPIPANVREHRSNGTESGSYRGDMESSPVEISVLDGETLECHTDILQPRTSPAVVAAEQEGAQYRRCKKVFPFQAIYQKHFRELCKKFTNAESATNVSLVRPNGREERFANESNAEECDIRRHRRIHSGEKPFVVSDHDGCGKAFARS